MMSKRAHNALRRRLHTTGGFSIAELLIAMLVFLLVTGSMVTGVQFAVRQYNESMIVSESKILASTLTSVIESELASTKEAKLGDPINGAKHRLDGFFSNTYANTQDLSHFYAVTADESGMTLSDDGFGEILLGTVKGSEVIGNLLVSSSAYSSFGLKARAVVTCETNDDQTEVTLFHVTLTICTPSGEDTIRTSFDVLPLNQVTTDADERNG